MRKTKIGGHPPPDTRGEAAAGASDGHSRDGALNGSAVAGAPISPAPSGDGGGDGHLMNGAHGSVAVSTNSLARTRRGAKKANAALTARVEMPSSPSDPVGPSRGGAHEGLSDWGERVATASLSTNNIKPALSALAADLAELQFRRTTYIREVNALNNRVRAMIRRMLGWRWDMTEAERAKLNKRAAAIHAAIEAGKPLPADDAGVAKVLAGDVMIFAQMRGPADEARKSIEADMRRLARLFPAWQVWGKHVRGFGELGFAVIVAEAGNLDDYSGVAKVWKRLGLAVINGERQQKKSDAELAVAHGYNPRRRAEMYAVIGDPLFRGQWRGADEEAGRAAGPIGPYGEVYAREKAKAAPRIDATAEMTGREKWTPLRVDRHARRLMTKALVRDLWRVWHGMPPRGMHVDDSEIGLADASADGGGHVSVGDQDGPASTTELPAGQHAFVDQKRNAGERRQEAGQYRDAVQPGVARLLP